MIDLETGDSRELHTSPPGWSRMARGALESVTLIACYAAAGLSWAAIGGSLDSAPELLRDASAPTFYAGGVIDKSTPSSRAAAAAKASPSVSVPANAPASRDSAQNSPSVWLIDGFNVLHAGLLGGRDRSEWWTESRRQELLDRVESFEDTNAELWIVFDGRHDAPETRDNARPRYLFAPSADAWLVERVREATDPTQLAVVTADRQVAGRARSCGAKVVSPRDFLARCRV